MKKILRTTITLVVALALVVTLLPLTAMAAPGDDDNTLKSIATDITDLNVAPTFSPTTDTYTLTLPEDEETVNITATANNAAATVSCYFSGTNYSHTDNVTVPVTLTPGASTTVQFWVRPVAGVDKSYIVSVRRGEDSDSNLATLTATAGTFNPTPYAPATTDYTLTITKETASTTLHATASSAYVKSLKVGEGATPTYADFNNTDGLVVNLANGESKTVKFQVTAQNNAVKVYTVTVTRTPYATINTYIKDDIGSGNPFAGVGVEIYDAEACTPSDLVDDGISDSNGLYALGHLEAGEYWVKVTSVPSGFIMPTGLEPVKVTLTEGQTKNVNITVAKLGNYSYFGNQLKSIGFTGTGNFTEVFNPTDRTITLIIDENQTSTRITPVLYDSSSTLYIAGRKVTYRDVSLKYPGSSSRFSIKIVPTKASGLKSMTYTLTVQRGKSSNTNLSTLTYTTNGVTVVPGFAKGTTAYTLTLSNTVSSFKVYPKVEGYKASYRVYTVLAGETTERRSNNTISLSPGQTKTVKIRVTAQNKTTKDYVITATRLVSHNADLKTLTATVGKTARNFEPVFDKGTLTYVFNLANTESSVKIVPTKDDATASYTMTSNGAKTSGTITVSPGSYKDVVIKVTAQDGTTIKEYKIKVQRAVSSNADLSSIDLSVGNTKLSPLFNADTTDYTLNLTYAQATVKITPKKADAMARFSMSLEGTDSKGKPTLTTSNAAYMTISLQPGQIRYLHIYVTAQDGVSYMAYHIRITRALS